MTAVVPDQIFANPLATRIFNGNSSFSTQREESSIQYVPAAMPASASLNQQ